MSNSPLVLVPCQHGGSPAAEDCLACEGSGFVKVVLALDGKPKECLHASNDGDADGCVACLGSGWAGLSG